jgi:uncharacterized protein
MCLQFRKFAEYINDYRLDTDHLCRRSILTMIIDAHIHQFSAYVIANVARRKEMVAELHLQPDAAARRFGPDVLRQALLRAGVGLALHLPTAKAADVSKMNAKAMALSKSYPFIVTAGTLHPRWDAITEELVRLHAGGVRALKFCSFSQEFQLDGPEALAMWGHIQDFNGQSRTPFFVVLDTYFKAGHHLGCDPAHITTPKRLAFLAGHYPEICFVGAHMGGLDAPVDVLIRDLPPSPNLYLDTSNAAHTLRADAFVRLLKIHGPEHILFGTDWPWFHPQQEIGIIDRLLLKAGFSNHEREHVFGANAAALLRL